MTATISTQVGVPGTPSKAVRSKLPFEIFLFFILIIAAFFLSFFYFSGKDKQVIPNQARSTVLPSFVPSITSTLTITPTITPIPTPLQGPGTYACDPEGVCGTYDTPATRGCPKTFADLHCLRECGDKSIRCPI